MAKEIIRASESLSVWESNMKTLSQKQPKLAQALQSYVSEHGHEFEHYENETAAGRWIDGLTERPFFEPAEEQKFDWTKKSRETPIFFQYGVGVPPYLFKVIRSLPKEALSLVVVEPNIGLLAYTLHLTHVYMAMPGEGSLTFLTTPELPPSVRGKPPEEVEKISRYIAAELRNEALMVGVNLYGVFSIALSLSSFHKGEQEAMSEKFQEIVEETKEWAVLKLSGLGNSAEDTMTGLRQMSIMSPWISYGYQFTSLLDHFNGRPFVVVSAGPSLDKNFELLRDIQDKCVIIATDAVLGKMIKSGIRPHIVCALERGLYTYNYYFAENLDNYPEECSKILLITQAVSTPKIFGRWTGPKIIIGKTELPIDRWFVLKTIGGQVILSGSSVAHMCYSIAAALGASAIALIGQDLAYAPDGFSHADGVYNKDTLDSMKKTESAPGLIKVPGALGGEVFTDEIWLMFLRSLENMVRSSKITTYDCTEGGALIFGTIVEPLADYIARETAGLEPLEFTPGDVVEKSGIMQDKMSRHEMLLGRIKKASNDLDMAENLLHEIVDLMQKVEAAGLTPKRRVVHAAGVARLLDELHVKNPMFAFVTQSYVYLSTMELTQTRFLDSVEIVERWTALHKEIVDAHFMVLQFIRKWLTYADAALDYYAGRDLMMAPPSHERAMEMLKEISATLGDGHDQTALVMEMNELLAAVDMPRLQWPGQILWQCAMFLLKQGRAEEAGVFMNAAAADFDDKEMPTDEIVSFLKDYARVLSTSDLCYLPQYAYAEIVLDNATALGGVDDEIREIKKMILGGSVSLFSNAAMMKGTNRAYAVKWFMARDKANQALMDGDVMTAMRLVWEMICEYGEFVPERAAPHLDWLAIHLEKFFGVLDEPYRSGVEELLDDIASRTDVLAKIPIKYSEEFIKTLIRHGLSVRVLNKTIAAEDEQNPAQEEETENIALLEE
jgi:hypothetical protein